jgi:hypothetical protein
MKLFISHSSKNKDYGSAIVQLLIGLGVKASDIIFTSNVAHGIPIGQNIFEWLKGRIQERSYILYLLSEEYYASVACLNEMGAAWVIGNKRTMSFVPGFDLTSYEFQNGALDPREIGFYLSDRDRVMQFVESLREDFPISDNSVHVNQQISRFLEDVKRIEEQVQPEQEEKTVEDLPPSLPLSDQNLKPLGIPDVDKYLSDLREGRLKDSDVLLIWYAVDAGKAKLMTGWQEGDEITSIRAWEEVNELNTVLSSQYSDALRRLEMRKLVTVSQETSSGNAKEMALVEPMVDFLLNRLEGIESNIQTVVQRNKSDGKEEESFPF